MIGVGCFLGGVVYVVVFTSGVKDKLAANYYGVFSAEHVASRVVTRMPVSLPNVTVSFQAGIAAGTVTANTARNSSHRV